MKKFVYSKEKDSLLRKKRGIGFEEVKRAIAKGKLVAVLEHYNKKKYPDQKLFLVEMRGYIYVVPFRESEDEIFLITIFPSRKFTKLYLAKNKS